MMVQRRGRWAVSQKSKLIQYQQVIAGYDDGLDPGQPRDLHVPEYTSLVRMLYTAISRKVVGKNVLAKIAKANMGYD